MKQIMLIMAILVTGFAKAQDGWATIHHRDTVDYTQDWSERGKGYNDPYNDTLGSHVVDYVLVLFHKDSTSTSEVLATMNALGCRMATDSELQKLFGWEVKLPHSSEIATFDDVDGDETGRINLETGEGYWSGGTKYWPRTMWLCGVKQPRVAPWYW